VKTVSACSVSLWRTQCFP